MGSVTGQFQSESPLHPAAREFLAEAFARGWSDPSKPHAESRRAAILLNEAKETFAGHLGIRAAQVEFLGAPNSGFYLGVAGLARIGSTLHLPTISRSELFALSGRFQSESLPVDLHGEITYPAGEEGDLLCWQSVNGETGIIAIPPHHYQGLIFVDATHAAALLPLPSRWHAALWDSRSWQGPAGLGVFALADRSVWHNPLPHIDQKITGSDFSLPLAIASAIALDASTSEYAKERNALTALNTQIRNFVSAEIGQVDIAGSIESTLPHLLSFSFLYIDAERLVSELDRRGFSIDSGSACTATNMEPSHVLAAMGLLTQGNVRMTLHSQGTKEGIEDFLYNLKKIIAELRN